MGHVRDAGHADLERDGDLLLDLFGGAAGPLGDDRDVVVGDVGVGLDGQVVEGDGAPAEEQQRDDEDDEAVVERKIDELDHADRLLASTGPPCSAGEGVGDDLLAGLRGRRATSCMLPSGACRRS